MEYALATFVIRIYNLKIILQVQATEKEPWFEIISYVK